MRSCICHREDGKLRRLVWFNESRDGIYLGYYGSDTEHHHSLHTDGARHLRNVNHSDLLPQQKALPITSYTNPTQLLNISLELTVAKTHSANYNTGDKAEILALLDESAKGLPERVFLNWYIMAKNMEENFLSGLRWPLSLQLGEHDLALALVVRLEYFPDHSVGFAVFRPRN